jgi:DNA-binding response OmpR family regulator
MGKPLIMIVDDCQITLDITRIHLEEAGFEVVTRSKPFGTTAEIMRIKPDCVLVDVSMPGLSGDKLIKLIREKNSASKVILFSAKDESELSELVNGCGADGYITKTDNKYKLANMVKSFLSR